jgi:hypothetical protein
VLNTSADTTNHPPSSSDGIVVLKLEEFCCKCVVGKFGRRSLGGKVFNETSPGLIGVTLSDTK